MKTKSRGWGSMTKAERKTEMARRRAIAEARKNPNPPPENPNQVATMRYSPEQHVKDLQRHLDDASSARRRIVDAALSCMQELMRAIR